MKQGSSVAAVVGIVLCACAWSHAQTSQPSGGPPAGSIAGPTTGPTTGPSTRAAMQPFGTYHLADVRMRDVCIMPDPASKTYYMVGPARRGVRAYTSKDLVTWEGPKVIYQPPADIWGNIPVVGIWAPEMHAYKGKYYLFLTFNTRTQFAEQWRNWRPRVYRGSQVLVGDAPTGPFKHFQNRSTPPPDMMTLDGTLWVEEGVPHMVFCHEWVQISNGSVNAIPLKDDLSEAAGEPVRLFSAAEAPWSKPGSEGGNYVTDGPSLYKSKSGKLFMIWSSFGTGNYTTGVAISDSGKLAGPWRQEKEAIFTDDGGHGMLFKTFEGQLMMVLHSPNEGSERPRVFEMEDTGETLRISREFTGGRPAAAR
ncbi:MAG TPA: glycoside hydrolase family 43 protein [Tepidisphaeraceae bacterium]|nr:glycoside hydrolase family 43 protein [Tepidisphaeraceae bacterium]